MKKPTIDTLIKLGLVIDTTSNALKKHNNKQYEIANPYNPNSRQVYYVYDNSKRDRSNLVCNGKYILRVLVRGDHRSYYYYEPRPVVLKQFNSKQEMNEYVVNKFIYHFFTQQSDGYADRTRLFSKDKIKQINNLDMKTITQYFSTARLLKDPNDIRKLFLKLFD